MIDAYIKTAETFAELSSARRLKVGAIIVKDDNIISFSWNGTPAGWDNNCEYKEFMNGGGGWLDQEEIEQHWPFIETSDTDGLYLDRYKLVTKPEVLHAEMNSLMKLAKSSMSGYQSTMFVTHSPCLACAKGIYQAGITEVFFKHRYRTDDGVEFLNKCKVNTVQV